MKRRLLVAISAHGYGHAAQTSCVVNALRQELPDLELILCTSLPKDYLASRFQGSFEHRPLDHDIGMRMASALEVRVDESAAGYARFHEEWEARIESTRATLTALRPDLVLANVPYAVLAAAHRVGLPAVGLCSLNWADIYHHYCGAYPNSATIHAQILAAYRQADRFLRATPGMPMTDLPNTRAIGPLARLGQNRRTELQRHLGLNAGDRIVLVGLGGIDTRLPIEQWPVIPGMYWLVPQAWRARRSDTFSAETCGMSFLDLLASSDALLTKPGYGSFTEAACNGVPVLYVERPDWPEEPYLVQWLTGHGACARITPHDLTQGTLEAPLMTLLDATRPARPQPTGIAAGVTELLGFFER